MPDADSWIVKWEEWRAKRWLDRRVALIEDIPDWRLVQELQDRGVLIAAENVDLCLSKTVSRRVVRPVDRDGRPLFRLLPGGSAPVDRVQVVWRS
jgi:hypothetical protein